MDVHAIRARIPLTQTCLYFNTGGISPTLDVVRDSLIHDIREIGETGPPPIMRPMSIISDCRVPVNDSPISAVPSQKTCASRAE